MPEKFISESPSRKQLTEPKEKHRTGTGIESRWEVWRWTWRGKEKISSLGIFYPIK